MAQHDGVIDNGPGLAVRTDINAAFQALLTQSSGPVEPTTKYPGMLWLDTTVTPDGLLRQRNQANTAWVTPTTGVAGPAISNIVLSVRTTSGNYVKSADLKFLEVTCVGGGGATANLAAAPATNNNCGGGAGAGAVCIRLYAASELAASEAYSIGLGTGAGGAGAAGSTIFKGLTAAGGGGGSGSGSGNTFTLAAQGAGGAATGGQINQNGEAGEYGVRCAHGNASYGYGGGGGGNMYAIRLPGVYSVTANGAAGSFPGGGSRGSSNGNNTGATNGAAGGNGCIILKEYF